MLGIKDEKEKSYIGIRLTPDEQKKLMEFIFEARKILKPGQNLTTGSLTKALLLDHIGYKKGKQIACRG